MLVTFYIDHEIGLIMYIRMLLSLYIGLYNQASQN